MRATGRPLIISTGMSTMEEIEAAVEAVGTRQPAHRPLHVVLPLPGRAPEPAHDRHAEGAVPRAARSATRATRSGWRPTWAAVTLGATFVERHITLDRAMWGSDQAASVEIGGLMRLVAEHPRHRAVAGRRRQARLRGRARRRARSCAGWSRPSHADRRPTELELRGHVGSRDLVAVLSPIADRRGRARPHRARATIRPYDRGQRLFRDGLLGRPARLHALIQSYLLGLVIACISQALDQAHRALAPAPGQSGWPLSGAAAVLRGHPRPLHLPVPPAAAPGAAALADPRGPPLDAPTSTGSRARARTRSRS